MNARFWVWWNDGWVKLRLKPGEVIQLYESHDTDEGFSFQNEIYEHDDDYISCHVQSGGRDCDGPLEHHSVYECTLQELQPAADSVSPPWRKVKAWQRDAYAEQMGY